MNYNTFTKEELITELSALKKENERLKESFEQKINERDWAHRKFRMLFERSPIGMALVDHKSGEFLEVNDAVLKSSGYTRDEFMNLSYWDITPIEYEAQEKAQIETLNKTCSFGPNTKEYIRKDGTRYPISISGALFTEINGEKVVWGIIEDITERKKAEQTIREQNEKLKSLNAAKNRFLTILAHDLKSPFTSLLGLFELILLKYNEYSRKELMEYIRMMNTVTQNTYSLLNDILLWIKADSNKVEFKPERIDINLIYNEIIESFLPIAKTKEITIIKRIQEYDNLYADKNMLKTILRNLISNAIKFTHKKGTVEINTQIKENIYQTTVSDTGIGISSDRLEEIFKVATNSSTTGTFDEKGTGLGLLICKEFVEKHGGSIQVKSIAGQGSSFTFEFPVTK